MGIVKSTGRIRFRVVQYEVKVTLLSRVLTGPAGQISHVQPISFAYYTSFATVSVLFMNHLEYLYELEHIGEERRNLIQGMACIEKVSALKRTHLCVEVAHIATFYERYHSITFTYESGSVTMRIPACRLCVSGGCAMEKTNSEYRFLQEAIDGKGGYRKHEVQRVFGEVASNSIAQEFLVNFLIEKWEIIYARLGNHKLIKKVLDHCLKNISSKAQIMLTYNMLTIFRLHQQAPTMRTNQTGHTITRQINSTLPKRMIATRAAT
ncbi:hypothetical protein Y032_0417g1095 [Ancylostoma ceylanicum]|uniref:ERAP1-like C-terminal domain-containing protein n=1 Tax=Ancylostoma ceylanicum TaxID=53326 RepID=A0A016X1M8_9BILA|nr:hypothetical protein Y032_0417g1095 [Ancylostoma ceylanicum]